GGGAVLQRAVNDIAVAGDPPNVGGAPQRIFILEIENPLGGEVGANGISASRVDQAFGLSRGSRGIEDVKRMLGVERLGRTNIRSFRHQLVPPVVTAGLD